MRLDLVMAIAGDERQPPRLVRRIEDVDHAQQCVRLQARSAFHADRIADAAHELDMGGTLETGTVAYPEEMRRSVVPVSGQRVLAGQRLPIAEQQRFMAGVECGALYFGNGFGGGLCGSPEGQSLTHGCWQVLA